MGKPGSDRAPSPVNPGDCATGQDVCHEGPPTRSRWGGYHQARPGDPGAEERLVPDTLNLKPQTFLGSIAAACVVGISCCAQRSKNLACINQTSSSRSGFTHSQAAYSSCQFSHCPFPSQLPIPLPAGNPLRHPYNKHRPR